MEHLCKSKVKATRVRVNKEQDRFNNHTSNNKFKSIPEKSKKSVFLAFDAIKKNNPESMADFAKEWIDATIVTGLRPSEWEKMTIKGNMSDFYYSENGSEVLRMVVQNAKFSGNSGRIHGKTRTLIMNRLSQADIMTILAFHNKLQDLIGQFGSFEKVAKSTTNVLLSANKKALALSSKYITLYSARHQFVSNRKANG